jgi:hypothetical protein
MFSSSELIEALRRRRRRSLRPERPAGEFPEGWSAWFASMGVKAGAVKGAAVESILAVFLAREPRLPPAALAELGRWRAFASLWRQEWHPASRDERGVRIFATVVSLLLHVVFSVVLVWLMYARFMAFAPSEAPRGEDVVQVEFIGEGTPEDEGGGPAQGETPQPVAGSASASTQSSNEPVTQPVPELPEPSMALQEETPPQPPAPPAAQPLQVTETPVQDSRFVLPPPRRVVVADPEMAVPEVSARPREIEVVETPTLPPLERRLPQREIAVPDLRQQPVDVVVREIPAPLPQVRMREVTQSRIPAPELSAQAPPLATREIPSTAAVQPSPSTGEGAQARTPSALTGSATTPVPSASGGTPRSAGGARPAATATGSGSATTPRAGATPSPRRADDWGDSSRNRPGGQAGGGTPGLFNPDGSPRLAGGDGRVGGGLPPGTITEDFEKIDRMGTWLKRPPIGYEPTSLDRFWVPHENLLEEWVRRNIREVLVPIPGTSKKIRCVVSLLQLGGGCGITDPNRVDIEADARKPPDVPFKPELQEDQDALLRRPAPTP